MNSKNESKILVMTENEADKKAFECMNFEGKTSFEYVSGTSECLKKLQTYEYDALVIDSANLMIGEQVNTYYLRTINELVPVIVLAENERPEIESVIREERIFYFLVKPSGRDELKSVITRAASWNRVAKEKQSSINEHSFLSGITKTLGTCLMFIFLMANCLFAGQVTVSVSGFQNLTGDPGNDWICACFQGNISAALKTIDGIKVIEPEHGAGEKVKYIISGSVQRKRGKAVVSYNIINFDTGKIILSDMAEGKIKTLFQLEDTITSGIMEFIRYTFSMTTPKNRASNKIIKKQKGFEIVHGDGTQGLKYSFLPDNEEALKAFETAIRENPGFADGYMGIGDIYLRQGRHSAALDEFFMALELYTRHNDKYFIGRAYYKIGEAYFQQMDYPNAASYFNKALKCKKGNCRDSQVTFIYSRLAEMALATLDTAKAVEYLNKSIKMSKKLCDTASQIEGMTQLACVYEAGADLGKARKCTAAAYDISERSNYMGSLKLDELSSRLRKRMALASLIAYASVNNQ